MYDKVINLANGSLVPPARVILAHAFSRWCKPFRVFPLRRLEQPLADELAFRDPARAGEEAAAGMGHELVQEVEFRQFVKNLDEPGPRVALVADEKQPGIVFRGLAPRRPPFRDKIDSVIVRIGPAQDLYAAIGRRSRKADMGAFRDDGIAALVSGIEVERIELAPTA